MGKVYLDNAATTKIDPQVLAAMKPFLQDAFGNPFSLHSWGLQAKEAIEKARGQVAKKLNCKPQEIIFTSCATEANNLALKGVVESCKRRSAETRPPTASPLGEGGREFAETLRPHIIVSPVEHHCVLDSAKHLEKLGVEVTFLPVDKYGLVDSRDVATAIKENTVLVSVMYVNNEVGTIEPIEEISKVVRTTNHKPPTTNQIYFHTDAVQAIQYLSCDVQKLGVDFLSLSAHKFHGPKGVGALYVREGTPLIRQMDGGGQEKGRRAGTHNVAGIVGLGEAITQSSKNLSNLRDLRDQLISGVLKIPGVQLTGHPEKRAPHIASFVIENVEGESLVLFLNEEGIAVSSGSACTSEVLEPSHVLTAMGVPPQLSHGSLRFSLSKYTTKQEIDYVLKVLPKVVEKLRKMAPK